MLDRKPHLDRRAIAIALACSLLWGLSQVATKAALTEIGPLWQAGLRSMLAALLLWLWARRRGVPLFERDGSLAGGLLAGTLFAAEFGCIFIGLQYTTASRITVFIYLAPFVVALGMPFIARSERLSAMQSVGLMLAFAAVAFAFAESFNASPAAPQRWLGDTLGLLAALLWGATTLTIRASRLATASAEKTLFYQLALSGLMLSLAAFVTGEPLPSAWSLRLIGLMGFQAMVVSFASYLLWFWLVRHYPATLLSSFTFGAPLFGVMAGGLLLGEPITARLLLALASLALGVLIVNRRETAPRPIVPGASGTRQE